MRWRPRRPEEVGSRRRDDVRPRRPDGPRLLEDDGHRRRAEDGVVRVLGCRVRMRVEGEGEPLLLLNGLTRPLESWRPVTRELTGRTLISFDAPGVGGSRTPVVPMSMSMLAALAAAVLAEAGHRRADVVGFSYGGTVAQQLAAQSPEVVGRLVLAATSCGVGATPGTGEALGSYRMPLDAALWPRPNRVGTLWHYLALTHWSSIPFLGALTVPTLVLCGSRDRLVPPANSVLLARRIPGARLQMLAAGHDLQRTGPALLLARAVDAFLPAGRRVDRVR